MRYLFTQITFQRKPSMGLMVLFVLFHLAVQLQSQITPGIATTTGTKVTFWDQRNFNGTDKIEIDISQTEPQSVNQGINLVNRISSVSIPLGIKVTFFDGNQANKSVRWTELYPGNYPYIGAWEDDTDFVLLEKIAVNEPVAYFYDK